MTSIPRTFLLFFILCNISSRRQWFLPTGVAASARSTDDNDVNISEEYSCDASTQQCSDQDAQQQQQQLNTLPSKHNSNFCSTSPVSTRQSALPLLDAFYNLGMTAQAYKPHAPLKDEVCRLPPVHSNNNNNGTSDSGEEGGESYLSYRLARFPFWRTTYHRVEDLVPIRIRGNIYSCDNSADIVSTFTND